MNATQGGAVRALLAATTLVALAVAGGFPARAAAAPGASPPQAEVTQSGGGFGSVGVAGAVSAGASQTQLVQDPYFADTSGGSNPYWTQYSTADVPTIDTDYYAISGWSSGSGDYTAHLCGYVSCDFDEVSQQITVPYGVTAASLSFEGAASCGPLGCGSSNQLQFELTNVHGAFVQDYSNRQAAYAYTSPPLQAGTSGTGLLSYLQANAGDILTVEAEANTGPSDDSAFYLTDITLTVTVSPPDAPTNVTADSTASGQATVSWTAPDDVVTAGVTGYSIITYDSSGDKVGTPQPVSSASTTTATITGLTNGTPYFFSVAAVNSVGTGTPAESNSVTPVANTAPPGTTAVSTHQYFLPNSDGVTWQVMDESNLAFTMTPSSGENVLLSANSDLWTVDPGYNQDLGILVTPSGGSSVLAAWKESGGFAGTYSPNAAFVETVYAMAGGTTYTVQVVWKTNKAAIGKTIAAGAGAGPIFSPTRLTADVLPAGAQTAVSTQQYTLPNSNGSSWAAMDATNLKVTLSGAAGEDAVVSGNSDLWTQDAGYNQDLGIFVSVNGGTATLVAWKESGGFAGTFSPNAAYVQTVYPMTAGDTYVFSLEWKTNIPASGTIIDAGAGTSPTFSPTRLTAYEEAAASVATAVSTQQYLLPNSDGSTWAPMDATNLVLTVTGSAETVLVSGNADLWTQNARYNQDLGIFVSVDGGTATLLAWKESGGFAGTYSPNAAYVQTVYTMSSGHAYVFSLEWKTNIPALGATIEAAAGGGPTVFSPTRLTVVPQT
jgi:hypothetical protein